MQLYLGVVIHNGSSDTALAKEIFWPYEQFPAFNSEFLLKPGGHPAGLHSVRVVGPSYDLATSTLRLIEVCFDPERYFGDCYDEALAILMEAGFKIVEWEDWFSRTWPWLPGESKKKDS